MVHSNHNTFSLDFHFFLLWMSIRQTVYPKAGLGTFDPQIHQHHNVQTDWNYRRASWQLQIYFFISFTSSVCKFPFLVIWWRFLLRSKCDNTFTGEKLSSRGSFCTLIQKFSSSPVWKAIKRWNMCYFTSHHLINFTMNLSIK